MRRKIEMIFNSRHSRFLALLSFLVSLALCLAVNILNAQSRSYDYLTDDYPTGYAMLNDPTGDYAEQYFGNLPQSTVFSCTAKKDIFSSMQTENGNSTIVLFGVDPGFYTMPLKSTISDHAIRFTQMNGGDDFSEKDILLGSRTIIMYESQWRLFVDGNGNRLSSINILGHSYKVIGSLKDTSDVYNTLPTTKKEIHFYMPRTTLNRLYEDFRDYFKKSYVTVCNIGNYRMPDDFQNIGLGSAYYTIRSYGDDWRIDDEHKKMIFFLVIFSFLAVFVVEVFDMRTRTEEIGVRRALGASRDDIVFKLVSEGLILFLCGIISAFVLSVFGFGIYSSVFSTYVYSYQFFYNFRLTILCLASFLGASMVGLIIPSVYASFMNISVMMNEER